MMEVEKFEFIMRNPIFLNRFNMKALKADIMKRAPVTEKEWDEFEAIDIYDIACYLKLNIDEYYNE